MSIRTESYSSVTNEDGSITTTETSTWTPPTTAEKAQAWTALGALSLLAIAPVLVPIVADKLEARREKKRIAKAQETLKSV